VTPDVQDRRKKFNLRRFFFPVVPFNAAGEKVWRRWMLRSLGVMTGTGLVAVLAPYVASGGFGIALSLVAALALFGTAGASWWQLRHMHHGAAEEGLLREAFHSMLTPQLITDASGAVVLANRAFRGWIDLGAHSALEALAARFGSAPDGAAKFKQLQENLYKGQSVLGDLAVMRGNRIIEWRRVIARPIDGGNRCYHWRFEDISERRRMERAMRDEQNKLLDFMAHAPVGIYSADRHGRFKFINDTLAEWLQVTPDELIKGDVRLHDVMNEPPPGIAAYALAEGPQGERRGEVMLRRRDGQAFPVEITQTVVAGDDGKTIRTRSIVRDLSPERQWQMALSVSEYRFQRLFAEAPIGIVLLNDALVIVECNQSFHSLVHRPRETIVSLPIADLIAAGERQTTMAQLRQVLAGQRHPVIASAFRKQQILGVLRRRGDRKRRLTVLTQPEAAENDLTTTAVMQDAHLLAGRQDSRGALGQRVCAGHPAHGCPAAQADALHQSNAAAQPRKAARPGSHRPAFNLSQRQAQPGAFCDQPGGQQAVAVAPAARQAKFLQQHPIPADGQRCPLRTIQCGL